MVAVCFVLWQDVRFLLIFFAPQIPSSWKHTLTRRGLVAAIHTGSRERGGGRGQTLEQARARGHVRQRGDAGTVGATPLAQKLSALAKNCAARRASAPRPVAPAATPTRQRVVAHRATYRDDRATTVLAAPQDADAVHCCLLGCGPVPSPMALIRPVLGTVPRFLRSKTLAPQTARWPACVAVVHRAHPLGLVGPPTPRESQRSPIPHARPPTHARAHGPSSSLNPVVRLVSTPLPLLLCRVDTMPSSSSSMRTSLLVYHLLPVISNYLLFLPPLTILAAECYAVLAVLW